ncbi:amino acid permease-domain-containing protein [Spinellus fusiger]|nr:amino acid permease-domain-containing protein [Spinellus fusiger]
MLCKLKYTGDHLKFGGGIEEVGIQRHTSEDEILASFGYKQLWGDAMMSGGPVAVIYGWIMVSFFTFGVGLSLAEICSAYPVTGGLYVWVSRLAPPEWVPIACWLTGWFAITSTDLGLSQFMASVIGINDPDYDAGIYWEYGIFLVIVFLHGLINSISVKYNGFFNQTSLYWHLVGTTLIIIVALALTPNKASAQWVFTGFENYTGFSSGGYVFLIGLLQSQYTLSGYDSAAHMSEETLDAARSAPRGILYAIGTAAIVGLAFMMSVSFCVQDFEAQIVNAQISPQMTQVFLDGVGYRWTIVFTVIIMGAMFFSGSALTLGSSRMVYAFSRDGAMPFSNWLSYINPKTKTPVYAVWGNILFASIVGLLFIVNTTAFNAIVSINTIASSLAYFIPIFLRITTARKTFKKGPFHLGPFSTIINCISCCWILITSILFLCPTQYPVTALNMNYACVPLVFVMGSSASYYHFRGRKWFTGPGKSLEPDSQLEDVSTKEHNQHFPQEKIFVTNKVENDSSSQDQRTIHD